MKNLVVHLSAEYVPTRKYLLSVKRIWRIHCFVVEVAKRSIFDSTKFSIVSRDEEIDGDRK